MHEKPRRELFDYSHTTTPNNYVAILNSWYSQEMIGTTDLEDQATTTSTGGRTPIFSPERAARQGDRGLFSRVRGPGLGPTRGRAPWADRDHRAITPLWRTADWGYLRAHDGHAPWPRYDWGCLTYWAGLIAETFTNAEDLSLIHISEPTRLGMISY